MKNTKLVKKIEKVKDSMRNNPDKALKLLRQIRLENIDNEDLYKIIIITAEALYNVDMFNEAISSFKKALDLPVSKKDYAKSFHKIGCCYFEKEEYTLAIEYLKKALDHRPDEEDKEDIYFWIALSYQFIEDFEMAVEFWKKRLDMLMSSGEDLNVYDDYTRERIATTYTELSASYWKLNNDQKSEECFQKSIEVPNIKDNERSNSFAVKAFRHFSRQQWKDAAECYTKAAELTASDDEREHYLNSANKCKENL